MSKEFVKCYSSKDILEILEFAKNALLIGFKVEITRINDLFMVNIYK